jgi:hypothetical protein
VFCVFISLPRFIAVAMTMPKKSHLHLTDVDLPEIDRAAEMTMDRNKEIFTGD